jgi:flagellar basal body-associated protein FliL
MENQNEAKRMKVSSIVTIGIVLFLLSSIVTGVGIYLWRESTNSEAQADLNESIHRLEDDLEQSHDNIPEGDNTNTDSYIPDDWIEYADPENLYSIRVPNTWNIEDTFEQGNNLTKDRISYTNFNMGDTYMTLTIAKLYSASPEYKCRPEDGEFENLDALSIDGYSSYDAFSMYNLDADYKGTTAYTYCYNIEGKKLRFEFVPESSRNNKEAIEIFYKILDTIDFK